MKILTIDDIKFAKELDGSIMLDKNDEPVKKTFQEIRNLLDLIKGSDAHHDVKTRNIENIEVFLNGGVRHTRKDIFGFENLYALTEDGELWSYGRRIGANHNGKYIKCSKDKDGYRRSSLKDKNGLVKHKRIGRLMLETYMPTSDKTLQANHKNGIRNDDRLSNLEWVTSSQNIKHSFEKLNKNQKGCKNNAFKIWGFEINGVKTICNDISVSEWCFKNSIASARIYESIRSDRELQKGILKGYKFFRIME